MTADAVPLRRPDNRAARVKQRDLERALKLAQRANMPIHSMRLEPDGVSSSSSDNQRIGRTTSIYPGRHSMPPMCCEKTSGWPRYMLIKQLSGSNVACYWSPHKRDKEAGLTLDREAIGPDYGIAVERAAILNAHLDAWRQGRNVERIADAQPGYVSPKQSLSEEGREARQTRLRARHARH